MAGWWQLGSVAVVVLGLVGCKDDPGGPVSVTFRIQNFNDSCTENTLYYKCSWNGEGGPDESLVTSVPQGGVSTFFIPAYDSPDDGDDAADEVDWEYSLFNPDPAFGCDTGAAGYTDFFRDGDMVTITVQPGGAGYIEEITRATSLSWYETLLDWGQTQRTLLSRKVIPARLLIPIPENSLP